MRSGVSGSPPLLNTNNNNLHNMSVQQTAHMPVSNQHLNYQVPKKPQFYPLQQSDFK